MKSDNAMSMTTKMLIASLPCLAWALLGCTSPCREFAGADWFHTAEVIDVPADVPDDASDDGSRGASRGFFNRLSIHREDLDGVPSLPIRFDRRLSRLPTIHAQAIIPDGKVHPFSLLVDTGAYRGAETTGPVKSISISGQLAKSLYAKLFTGSGIFIQDDAAGRSVGADALLEHVTLGNFSFDNALASVTLGRVSDRPRVDGRLRVDFLRAFEIAVFDWEARRIWLARPELVQFDLSEWTGVPMLNTKPGGPTFVSVEARFGEHTFPAMLDTGASDSSLPMSLFDAMPSASRRPIMVMTAGVNISDVDTRAKHPIEIGDLSFPISFIGRKRRAFDRTDDGSPIAGLIGMDVLRQRAFALDFKNNTVWFAPEGWRGPPRVAEPQGHSNPKGESRP